MDRPSLWHATASLPEFPPLGADAEADVVVVGGGIAGVTAALLLQRAGRRTLLLEAWRLGGLETGHTTAHLTELLDARYHALESRLGRDAAGLAGASARAAIDRIEAFAGELGENACGFARVPAYLVAVNDRERRELQHELAALQRAGADAGWTDDVPYPLPVEGAIRVERQAQLHPLAYLGGLAGLLAAAGGRIHEHTRALAVRDGEPCRVETERGTVRAPWAIVLTNHPVSSRFAIHTKIAAYRTYAVALGPAARDRFRPALVYDMADPYHYVRTQDTADGTFLVVGGEDHKTGHARDAKGRFASLERWARRLAPDLPAVHRWSGQILEPADGLPFIGRSPGSEHVLVGTGFSGTGMTFGTLAGDLLAGEVTGAASPYASLYDAGRVRPLAQARRFVIENADVAATLLARDRLSRGEVRSVDEIPPGEGRLVRSGGAMLAVSRGEDGTLRSRSAVCRHLGCHVQWNDAERSWDCPCHGSRYDAAGEVLNGPTTKPLEAEPAPAGAEDERPPA